MELNKVTSVSELLWKFTPHFNSNEFLMHETINNSKGEILLI